MRWCIFVNRICCGDDCVGWIEDGCFVYLLLSDRYREKQLQTEIDWTKYESLELTSKNSLKESDDQMSFLNELEKLITQQTH